MNANLGHYLFPYIFKAARMVGLFSQTRGQIRTGLIIILFVLFLLAPSCSQAQNETIPSGSFIIDMGVMPQTVGNGLKPFGMIYDLIKNYHVPVKWVIAPGKVKDGVDFSYGGVDYRGGPFIISQVYRTTAVNSRITYWQSQGVVGITTTSPMDVPVAKTLVVESIPRWTMDLQNGSLAVPYFTNAGIPPSAYSLTKTPAQLNGCDDIFVIPHADPTWATHQNLLVWNQTYHGSIWTSCHAGSTLSNMFNPAIPTQQSNFLSEKTGTASGSGPYCENSLVMYSNHGNGTPPYTYSTSEFDDPFMQFMGTIDAAMQNGSEQVYIPLPASLGWRSTTTVAVYDNIGHPSGDAAHRAAIVAYGRAFGDSNNGYVMFEAGHSHAKATLPSNIAAQRIFFNFSFMAGKASSLEPTLSGIPASIISGVPTEVSFAFPAGANPNDYIVTWSAACGGTFVNNPSDKTRATFTPPVVTTSTNCAITVSLKDLCDRIFSATKASVITCDMQIVPTLTKACKGSSNGSISLAVTGVAGPFGWSWSKSGGGTGTGSSPTSPVPITGLAPGDYTVTVTAGSSKVLSLTILENPQINSLGITPVNVRCNGGSSGSITVADPSGGTPPFTFLWNDAVTTQSRTGLIAGTYSVTAKDANNCPIASGGISLTQPGAIVVTPTVTNLLCYGNPTGAISLGVTGGTVTGTYTYAWNDGPTTQNRSNLAAGPYTVTVSDDNGCTASATRTLTQGAAISVSASAGTILRYGGTTTLTVTASGGTGTLLYSLNGGAYQAGNTFTVSASASDYIVTVKDANNCTATTTVTVTQPGPLSVSTTITNVSCFGGAANGKIDMAVTGGPGGFTYNWSRTGGSGSGSNPTSPVTISGLAAGEYTVTVTANNGTGSSSTFTVTVNENPQLTVTPVATNLVCNGVSTGSISLTVSGGTPTYSYAWGDGPTTQNRIGLAANTYNVTVTDSKGCTKAASPTTLTQPDPIVITPTVTDVLCNGSNTGAISLAVSGGTGPYTYAWTDGPATQNRANLPVGTYQVTVTDSKNCTGTLAGIAVNQPVLLSLSATSVNVGCFGGSTGSIDLTPAGGTIPYNYDWGGGIVTQDRTGLPAGTYLVTVTDHKGCKAELQKTISQNPAITLSASLTHETCPSGADSANGAVNLTVLGGSGSFSYSWTGPGFTLSSKNIGSLKGGTYTVVVTDTGVAGCTATTSVTIKTLNSNPVKPTAIN